MDELDALQQVIQALHELMSVLSDPKDTAVASQCLTALTRVQQDMMMNRGEQGNPDEAALQAMLSQLGGAGGAAPPPQPAY